MSGFAIGFETKQGRVVLIGKNPSPEINSVGANDRGESQWVVL